jgi:8-oxo-dGTP pyrophosphatase MutT (NUDIX family)
MNSFKNNVGVIFFSKSTNRHLFLLRNDRYNQSWGLPGGKCEYGETLLEALRRECIEEINYWPDKIKLFPIEQFTNDKSRFVYHTFYCMIEEEFIPTLNNEHIGYCWINHDCYPRPLHRGLFNTLTYSIIQQKIQIIRDSLK